MTEDRAAFLAARRSGIGSSDAPMLARVSPFGGPWRVWESKVNPPPTHDDAGPAAMWGRKLEDIVARDWASANGRKIQRRRRQFRSTRWEFAIANPDRFVVGEKSLVEVKVVFFRGSDWGDYPDEVPAAVAIQCQHQMAVTGTKRVYVPVFFAARADARDFLVERDDALIEDLMVVEEAFWKDHVLTGTPPPPDGSDDARHGLARLHPKSDTTTITATPEQNAVVGHLLDAMDTAKALDEVIQGHKNTLKAVMGDAGMMLAAKARVTWRRGARPEVDWKAVVEEIKPGLDSLAYAEAIDHATTNKPTDVFRVTRTGDSDA